MNDQTIYGQPSWVLESTLVRMAVTHLGAHMAPVFFGTDTGTPVQPYHVSSWQGEQHSIPQGQSEHVLRGDFFCLPFGYAEPSAGVPSHGRTAGGPWSFRHSGSHEGIHELSIHMENALYAADVTRQYLLRDGENVIYDRTTISGLEGAHTLGHHAVLRLPWKEHSFLVSTSELSIGMTYPRAFREEEGNGRQTLGVGSLFDTLSEVPSAQSSDPIDCSAFPARHGSSDLLQIAARAEEGKPAWTAAVNTEEGYLWFSMRDPASLPSTLFWIENRGRQSEPWNGKNSSLGLEDICSFFDCGSEISNRANPFSDQGIKTVHRFETSRPTTISYLQGIAKTPHGFGRVRSAFFTEHGVIFTDEAGLEVSTPLDTGFLFGEELKLIDGSAFRRAP